MNRITIFHYHLMPGGVTNVILLGATALIRNYPNLGLLRIVCGREENTEIIKQKIEKEIDSTGVIGSPLHFEICIEPEIDYRDDPAGISTADATRLADKLADRFGDSFWWIHNYQLGKNPLYTAAVMHTAKFNSKQKMLLHIHDFPECARYENLEKLRNAGVHNPYPVSDNSVYALINGRDTAILRASGVPEDRVFLLNNPIEDDNTSFTAIPPDEAAAEKTAFYNYFKSSFPAVNPEAKMIFYPVRTIRRKNALEAGLIAALSKTPVNLILSLPGVSASEKAYSDTCEECFKTGLIPGIWGSGTVNHPDVPSYPRMLQLSDLILSSSVQEGFGYLFINSVRLGTPLTARYLDILDGVKSAFPKEHTYFYNSISVPVEHTEAKKIRESYSLKLNSLNRYISEKAAADIRDKTDSFGAGGTIDFSFLSVEHQVDILKRLRSAPGFKNDVHSLNRNLMTRVYEQLDKGKYSSSTGMAQFSLKAHSNTIEQIINRLYSTDKQYPETKTDIQQKLLDSFAEPNYMRLLYDY